MPCHSRSRMHHCRGPGFHPYAARGGFHPLFMMMQEAADVAAASVATDEESELVAALFGKDKTRWTETEEKFTFQMDIPGVKAHQVTVEEKDGEMEVTAIRMKGDEVVKTYQDVFFVPPSKADLTKAVALVDEGVLTVSVPKKVYETLDIAVEARAAPMEADDSQGFRVSMDLPGVKVADLKVQFREGAVVYVEATRNVGGETKTIRRAIKVDAKTTDMKEASVYLLDGVFTFVAPTIQPEEAKRGAVRKIEVREVNEDDVAAFESLTLTGATKKTETAEEKKGEMEVETVAEEEKDWEEVEEAANEEKME